MKRRIPELDLMKTFIIVISMIGIHTMYDLTVLTAEDGAVECVLNILASQYGAPMFMFCMGVSLCFSRHQEPADMLKRGVRLLTSGMVLNALRYLPTAYSASKSGETDVFSGWAQIFNVDILQFAGLAFMLLALLRKLRVNRWRTLLLGLALNAAGTLLDGCFTESFVVNQILGYFYPTHTCCCFPLMNWFIFVAAGNAAGRIYLDGDVGKFLRIAFPAGAVLTAVYMYLCLVVEAPFVRALQNDWGFYSMHAPDALFTAFGIAPFMLGLFRILAKAVPEKWDDVLFYPARHINQFYCVSWVLIMWTANFLLFVPKATDETGFLLVWSAIVVLTAVAVVIYDKFLKQSVNLFFGRHSAAWTVGVWAVLLLFGVWYFASVPGPYTMPY